MIVWILASVLAAYAVVTAVLYLMQDRMVYHPTREIEATPDEINLTWESIELISADGTRLSAWFIPSDKPDAPAVLFCHGNGGNVSHRLATMQILHRLGLSVLVLDYRGYGRSEGRPSEQGTYDDARAAWDYLTVQRGIAPERILLHGRSLGGSIASQLAGQVRPAGLILESVPTSIPEVGSDLYWFIPGWMMRTLCRYRYNTREHLAAVECPVLVLHSPHDEIVPFSHGQANYRAAGDPKRFVELTGGHNDAHEVSGEMYTRAIGAFVARCIEPINIRPAE